MLIRNSNLIDKLGCDHISRLTCVMSDDDTLIENKIIGEFANSKHKHKIETIKLRRARRVGQSYLTSIWTTFIGILQSIHIVFSEEPQICLTNGPAISVTMTLAIRCLQLATLGRKYACHIIYIESFCRTRTLSLSGRIIYHLRLASRFFVQWPSLQSRYRRATFRGILV